MRTSIKTIFAKESQNVETWNYEFFKKKSSMSLSQWMTLGTAKTNSYYFIRKKLYFERQFKVSFTSFDEWPKVFNELSNAIT